MSCKYNFDNFFYSYSSNQNSRYKNLKPSLSINSLRENFHEALKCKKFNVYWTMNHKN